MKKYIFTAFLLIILAFGACFTYCTDSGDEAIVFGGYCYYIENGDIYRAPMTDLAGETVLFRKDSLSIALEGSNLISISSDGNFSVYSLISEDEFIFKAQQYNSSGENDLLLGSLSAKYESNGNPAAISKGNDAGGVSFGAYQFASNAGVPKAFADWCISSGASPEIGNRLLVAYKDDGSACGESFKAEWLAIAKENSNMFLAVQHRYVKEKYYDAIVARIEKNVPGFKMDIYGIALQNVFWSRSVQHGVGGSYNVITRAFESIGGFDMQSEEILIRAIYAESGAVVDSGTYPMTGATAESLGIAGKYMKYYSKNSSAVQISVYKRLNINEPALALEMLEEYGGYEPPVGIEYEFKNFSSNDISENSATISAVLNNYKHQNITEYGFFIGKSLNSLTDIPLFVGATSVYTVDLTKKFISTLESGTTYYYGAYAFVGGEYITSDIFTFKTANEIRFKVSYIDYDGSLLYETTVKKGSDAVFIGSEPMRKTNAQCSYSFNGWDRDGKNITSDTVIKAVYIEKDHLWNGNIADSFESGDGSSATPYIISSPNELAYLSYIVKNGFDTSGKFFKLANNIVLRYGKTFQNFTPIGTEENPFKGTFSGDGYKIIGLTVLDFKNAGLFGVICGAKVDSLIIENAQIEGETAGILAGKITDDIPSIISNCSFSGNVFGKDFAGGTIGNCSGYATFSDIYFSGNVSAKVCGGLYGLINNGIVQQCLSISLTEGEKNDAICAIFSENVQFSCCYYSDCDISAIGKALNEELMKNQSGYSGFDFSEKWDITEEHAKLKIFVNNDFEYCKYGDANRDGFVDIVDVTFIAQYLAQWDIALPVTFEKASDIDGNGDVSISDLIIIAQHLAGWDVNLIK